jgi:hypothetical protein
MLDHLRGTRGMIGRSRRPTVARFKKEGSFLWKLGGDAHHYRFFLKEMDGSN